MIDRGKVGSCARDLHLGLRHQCVQGQIGEEDPRQFLLFNKISIMYLDIDFGDGTDASRSYWIFPDHCSDKLESMTIKTKCLRYASCPDDSCEKSCLMSRVFLWCFLLSSLCLDVLLMHGKHPPSQILFIRVCSHFISQQCLML